MKAKATGETGADRPAAPYVAASAAAGELPRGDDWRLELHEGCFGTVFDLTYRGVRRSFEIRPGEAVDLRIIHSRATGPAVLFMRHGPDTTR